jgi:hypothetical protein
MREIIVILIGIHARKCIYTLPVCIWPCLFVDLRSSNKGRRWIHWGKDVGLGPRDQQMTRQKCYYLTSFGLGRYFPQACRPMTVFGPQREPCGHMATGFVETSTKGHLVEIEEANDA